MKKFILTLVSLLLYIEMSHVSVYANVPIEGGNILKQGIFKVGNLNEPLKPGKYSFRLITDDAVCYVLVIDKDILLRFDKRFDSTKPTSQNSLFTAGTLLEGDSLIILGNGEFYFNTIN